MPESSPDRTPPEVSDEMLMARYAAGDAEAFELLFERYEPRVYGFFLKRARSPERAQDLYQELFLRVHRARDVYDASRPFAPWLFRIAERLWADDRERAYRSREVALGQREPRSASPDGERCAVVRGELREALAELSPEEGYVLVSAKAYGVQYDELAAQLGKSVAAIKQLASRAMRRLRAAHGAATVAER